MAASDIIAGTAVARSGAEVCMLKVSAANTLPKPDAEGAAMQTWWFLALAVAVVHGGTIRQESGALAIAHDTDARPR